LYFAIERWRWRVILIISELAKNNRFLFHPSNGLCANDRVRDGKIKYRMYVSHF